jgi:tRNA (guanine-N7-)-methyltransferase
MLAVVEASAGFRNRAGAGRYAERPAYRPQTKFERRGLRLGHAVRDLVFERV